jgi:hypothetical protein
LSFFFLALGITWAARISLKPLMAAIYRTVRVARSAAVTIPFSARMAAAVPMPPTFKMD